MITRLSVNLNKVALLRNARSLNVPSVLNAGHIALSAGAAGLTVHPRPDERHIRPQDVEALSQLVKDHGAAELNIEGNPFENLLQYARTYRPHQCTLVPDAPEQTTSDHGWDLVRDAPRLRPLVAELKDLGIRVSLFMDPEAQSMALAAQLGADRVELYTESYARAFGTMAQESVLATYARAASAARDAGLMINAGHDLNRLNLATFIAATRPIAEVSIGHALIAEALEWGLKSTVETYLEATRFGSAGRVS